VVQLLGGDLEGPVYPLGVEPVGDRVERDSIGGGARQARGLAGAVDLTGCWPQGRRILLKGSDGCTADGAVVTAEPAAGADQGMHAEMDGVVEGLPLGEADRLGAAVKLSRESVGA